ncbi:MAG: hypothetical protein ACR2G5_07910 [Pyrinomonadaceae bacterium]
MAADLENEHGIRVERVKGGLGELSVSIDETKIFDGNRLWYPTPGGVIKKVRAALGTEPPNSRS